MTRLYLRINHQAQSCQWLEPVPANPEAELTYQQAMNEYAHWQKNGVFQLADTFYCAEEVILNQDEVLLILLLDCDDLDITTTLDVFNLANTLLDNCTSQDEICLHGVKFIRDVLNIDRAAVLLLAENKTDVLGTWGTDEHGELVQEKDLVVKLENNEWMQAALKQSGILLVKENAELINYDRVVGTGWHAIISIYHRKEPIGWLCCDNLITQRPLSDNLRSQIAHFGNMLGQWLIRVKNENELNTLNESLEYQVAMKTEVLQKTIDELTSTQQNLVRTEKTKALSTFTAGVAHEINNPIGFIRSNLSFISKVSTSVVERISEIDLPELEKPKQLLDEVDQVIDESVEGLDRVKNIISMLQPLNKLADEVPQTFDIVQAVEFAVMGLSERNELIEIKVDMPSREVSLPLQIFTLAIEHILENSLDATKDTEAASIVVTFSTTDDNLIINCTDNGYGISAANISSVFLPFFTTKAPGEGLGLGLSLSQNLIQLANGDMRVESREGRYTSMSIIFNKEVLNHA